ncbi:MAG: hypothetical protein IH968_08885 [Gemmatimonadetes bacterium]|nr:hypothetical protein [Gemmatimonadota bacterium]
MTRLIKNWLVLGAVLVAPLTAHAQISEELVRSYLWPATEADFERAAATLASDPTLVGVSRMQMHDLAELMRMGRPATPTTLLAPERDSVDAFIVSAPGGREIPVWVRVPSRYTPDAQWPLMFAMHGGPPGNEEGARRSAQRMVQVWVDAAEKAGWIVASPAMVSTVSRDGRTQERLPYEIFHPEEARAVIDAVRERYSVAPDRIVSTGISLGSNFSIGFAAAHPDWFSAIVPVSTEGESREHLLRNLQWVPTYVLEGSQDQNIRGVGGPRALSNIMTAFGYDLTYREFADRAHEGFQDHYDDVLRWLDNRPRRATPREVLRVPHSGIMPVARRVHWIEADTRQALVHARVSSPTRIDITARWARELTLYLNDELSNLDEPLTVAVNGRRVFSGTVPRSVRTALEQARLLKDERRVYAARLTVEVPISASGAPVAAGLWEALLPKHPEGQMSFWEMYAVRALEERFPDMGFGGEEAPLPQGATALVSEQVAMRVTDVTDGSAVQAAGLEAGDLLLSVGDEPFFRDRGGVAGLYHWLLRELRETPAAYEMMVWRDGVLLTLEANFQLGSYVQPDSGAL